MNKDLNGILLAVDAIPCKEATWPFRGKASSSEQSGDIVSRA